MKLTSLLQLVGKLQQAGKIDNLQQVCGVFDCVHSLACCNKLLQDVNRLAATWAFFSVFTVSNEHKLKQNMRTKGPATLFYS